MKKPRKFTWKIEFEPATPFQEEVFVAMMDGIVTALCYEAPRRHKKNVLNIERSWPVDFEQKLKE